MKILITGANGFTGLHLTVAAENVGFQVVALEANLNNKEAIKAEVQEAMPDLVVHLGALSFVGHQDALAFYDVNVLGTINLLDALTTLPVQPSKVLLASSANIYGNCAISPIKEDQLPRPVNHYSMSKLAMEYLASTYLDRLPIVIARPFNYTGAGQTTNFLIPKLVSHFVRREVEIELGNLYVEREFNDVRMVCNAYLALLAHGVAGEVYNVCSGSAYSLRHVISLLATITGHSMDVLVNPAFVRANEVNSLCGSPDKLIACVGGLKKINLEDTLRWMLDA